MKSNFMRGTQNDSGSNPPVQSKFDKSHGKGLKAPHLSFPGATMGVTSESMAYKKAREVGQAQGSIKTTHYSPSQLGTAMSERKRMTTSPNMAATGRVPGPNTLHLSGMIGFTDPQQSVGGDRNTAQRSTGSVNNKMGGGTDKRVSAKQVKSDNRTTRSSTKQDAGALAGNPQDRTRYSGGKGRV